MSADDFQVPIDDPDFRVCLIDYWKRRGKEVVVPNLSISDEEAQVIDILGKCKVVTLAQAAMVWAITPVPTIAPIHYSSETLRECAHENQSQNTDWRLVCINGFSLREQRERIGTDRNRQPCFYNNDWWLQESENEWATFKPEADYYLVNFKGRFGSTSWEKQEKKIAGLGNQFERAHETVVAEAVFSVFKTTGERLLEKWYHWSQTLDSFGRRVLVGGFDRGGLVVDDYHPDWLAHDGLRVCLLRKFNT